MSRGIFHRFAAVFLACGLAFGARAQHAPADPSLKAVDARIVQLHQQLAITEAEAPQWQMFADAMRDNARHLNELFEQREADRTRRSALDDISSYAALAQAHADDLKRLVAPFGALYAVMPPDQQKRADAVFRRVEARQVASHG